MSITVTLLIQGLAFFAVAWLVMKFGWPHIMAAIEERQKKIAEGLAAGERAEKELAEARNSANEILKEAHARAGKIVDQANRRSNELVDEARGAAIAEGQRLIAEARQEVQLETSRAREQLRKEVAALAVSGATRLLGREIDANAHAELLDKLALEIERAA
jgi:F-type H+-transporting ATPase subunit b